MSLNIDAKIGFRIDTKSNWHVTDPVLIPGEVAVTAEPRIGNVIYYDLRIGDGTDQWSEVPPSRTFISKKETEDFLVSYFNANDRYPYLVIHPYNNGTTDANADFTCTSSTNNTAELNTYISSTPANATLFFGKGNYIINNTVSFGTRKVIFDFDAYLTCQYNSSITSGETPFVSVTTGHIINGTFVYTGTGSIYQPCISASSSSSKIKDCYMNNFMKVFSGTGVIENNIFEHSTEAMTCNVTSGALVKGNTFKSAGNLGIINVSGASRVIYNNVGTINLAENAGAVSAFNVVANPTISVTGNKVNDFNIGV